MEILGKCPPFQEKHAILNILKNTDYNILTYNDIMVDETRMVKKIKKGDYLAVGGNQIVDQGKEPVGGYTNDEVGIYNNTPFIVFGDHTRVTKYIDIPSFIGADGVKVINVKDDMLEQVDMKYLYYYLTYADIPNDGYSRHFKYLKSLLYIVPPIDIQHQIVQVLDKAQKLIDQRKEQIELLDDLIESLFYDMFGSSGENGKNLRSDKLSNIITINPRKSEVSNIKDSNLKISFVPMENVLENGRLILGETRNISEVYRGYTYFKENDVLFAKITPCMENGKGCIATGLVNDLGFGSTEFHVLRPNDNSLTKEFIFYLTKSQRFRIEAESKMTGSAGQKRVPRSFIEEYIVNVPPLSLQNEFAEKVELIEQQKQHLEESLALMKDNYNSLMQRAFNGELF